MNLRSKTSTRDGGQGPSGVSKMKRESEVSVEDAETYLSLVRDSEVSSFESLSPNQLQRCLSFRDGRGRSLLHIAALECRTDLVAFFHERSSGSLINRKDYEGVAPIHSCILDILPCMVKELLRLGADIASPAGKNENTPIHLAASTARTLDIAKALIDSGANVNAKNRVLSTPLHYAATCGRVEMCKLLIGTGAELDAEDQEGQTPLTHAVINEIKEVVRYLLDCGADRKVKTEYKVLNRYPEDYLQQDPLKVQKTRKPIKEFFNKQPVRLLGLGLSYSYFYPPLPKTTIKQSHPKSNHKADDDTILECAIAALSWYNCKHPNAKVKDREYELVTVVGGTVLPSLCHCNFIARPKDRRQSKGFLFFAEVHFTKSRKICHVCSMIRKREGSMTARFVSVQKFCCCILDRKIDSQLTCLTSLCGIKLD